MILSKEAGACPMTEQEKQGLIERCSKNIAWTRENLDSFPGDREEMLAELQVNEIALAALTAPPAVNLADLVPGMIIDSLASIANEYQTSPQNALFIIIGWNACCAEMLRRIEESGKC